jgi:aryl-alcohol dehydrogenase-like predicted oxidoreductase
LKIAKTHDCTGAQLALAWLLNQHPDLVAIPGTTSVQHMQDNIAAGRIQIEPQAMLALEAMFHAGVVMGNRYNAQARSEVDTEEMS